MNQIERSLLKQEAVMYHGPIPPSQHCTQRPELHGVATVGELIESNLKDDK